MAEQIFVLKPVNDLESYAPNFYAKSNDGVVITFCLKSAATRPWVCFNYSRYCGECCDWRIDIISINQDNEMLWMQLQKIRNECCNSEGLDNDFVTTDFVNLLLDMNYQFYRGMYIH